MGGQKFVEEHRAVVPNDRLADTSVVVLVADDPTATRKDDELSEERGAVSVLVPFATSPSAARRRSVHKGA